MMLKAFSGLLLAACSFLAVLRQPGPRACKGSTPSHSALCPSVALFIMWMIDVLAETRSAPASIPGGSAESFSAHYNISPNMGHC